MHKLMIFPVIGFFFFIVIKACGNYDNTHFIVEGFVNGGTEDDIGIFVGSFFHYFSGFIYFK